MNKNLFHLLLALPIVLISLSLIRSGMVHYSWPDEAVAYLNWYRSQPLSNTELLVIPIANGGLVLFVLSTIGLMMFWPPSRYLYVASIIMVFAGDAVSAMGVPVVFGGWDALLDSLSSILVGINIGLVFSRK